jgi:hypothetical protein
MQNFTLVSNPLKSFKNAPKKVLPKMGQNMHFVCI